MKEQDLEALGHLFPAGGRVAPEQMIGREGDVADLVERLREFSHLVLSGPRRAGKTSVCGAACAALRDDHNFLVMEVEVPEQSSAEGVCQLMIDRAARLDLKRISQGLLKAAVPAVQSLLSLARLGQRLALAPTIPADQWRAPLHDRFGRAGLLISEHRLERILEFGEERPYDTMVGCLLVGQNARRVQSDAIDDFVLSTGLEEARVRLDEDD